VTITTSHPSMIAHISHSADWRIARISPIWRRRSPLTGRSNYRTSAGRGVVSAEFEGRGQVTGDRCQQRSAPCDRRAGGVSPLFLWRRATGERGAKAPCGWKACVNIACRASPWPLASAAAEFAGFLDRVAGSGNL
jgi:hypothetical protein